MTERVVGYIRVSTFKQDIERQKVALRATFPQVERFFVDDGIRSTTQPLSRPAFKAAVNYCKDRGISLAVTAIDRVTRGPVGVRLSAMIAYERLNLVSLDGKTIEVEALVEGATMGMKERALISDRTASGMARIRQEIERAGKYVARSGKIMTSMSDLHPDLPRDVCLAAGRRSAEARRLAHARHVQKIVPLAEHLASRGLSRSEIAVRLNDDGYATWLGRNWTAMSVYRLLRDRERHMERIAA